MGGEAMKDLMLLEPGDFTLLPDRELVFSWLRCGEDRPCFPAYACAWDQATAVAGRACRPRAAMNRDGQSAAVFITLGAEPDEMRESLFREERYILGSLFSTLCDALLFQAEEQAARIFTDRLSREGLYLKERREPGADFGPEEAARLFDPFRDVFPGASVSESGMLLPTKSMMYALTLASSPCGDSSLHDCSRCSAKDCLYRKK